MVQPIDSNEVKSTFLTELRQLLGRYRAEIEIMEKEGSREKYIQLYIPSIHSKSGDTIQESIDVDLGTFINGAPFGPPKSE